MRKVIASGVCLLTFVIVFFVACHKNTSSSSGSGSIGGAMEDLALLSLGAVKGNASFPSIGVSCTSSNVTASPTLGSNSSGTCPSGYVTPVTYTNTPLISETFNHCVYGGYTYNGTLSFEPSSSGILYCQPNGSTTTGIYVKGTFNMVVPSSFTITGNGLNTSCTAQYPMNATVSVTYTQEESSPFVGVISGPACGTTLPNLGFY